ncbi:efflux RND transporter periplasmic adaptor subunit [Flavobacterium album]|uniref:Efflux RND transporter periplasmic adaptor subunit n=1 Tax=Flavobacterium album TaxID=2175091 RepID=A0A2S1QUP8_9FLAO|nr:efflux RND transporter periplasmic adaptor subunit [Flavobacterium album]AWH84103.1 efflux RND transporter periplasmic adaptor subunit [Flavobacterium album]
MQRHITALLLLLLALTGCDGNKGSAAKGTEAEPLAQTLYTDKTELFVQYNPLIVGEVSTMAAHLTRLGDVFKPLTDAKVTISLIVNGKGIKNTAPAPEKGGLYVIDLKPSAAGKGTLVIDIVSKDLTDKFTIDNVEVYANAEAAQKAAHHYEDAGAIAFSKEQAWNIEFATTPAVKQDFHEVIRTNGQLVSAPGDEMVIAANADGIVRFSGSKAQAGMAVQQGTALFTISGDNLTQRNVDSSIREAKANYLKLKTDYERASELIKDKIISQREFQTTKLAYENALNDYNTVSKNYSGKGLNIVSPMSGFISSVSVTDGQFVQAGAPLATISKNKRLLLKANVSQRYFSKLPGFASANFTLPDGKTYDTNDLNGKVASFGKSAAANSAFLPISFEIDNTGGLISGSTVQVFLKSDSVANALVIPFASIMEEQGIYYVYVQTGGESFAKREVQLGANDGKNVQVLKGVTEGERVVSKGAYQIKLSSASGAMPAHSHEH